jgi:hypothetical protein
MRRLAIAAMLLGLAACATPTPYAPSASSAAQGFSERQIEADRFAVTFRGNSITPRETVEDYLLFRAAELTLEKGKDHFIAATRATDAKTRTVGAGASARAGLLYDYWYYSPYFGWRSFHAPFGWSAFDAPTLREVTQFEATMEIAMFNGAKPAGNAMAYDARDVMASLSAKIVRPTP